MTPWQLSAWGLQFVVEAAGAWFAWRRRIRFLFWYLAFAAAGELVTGAILWLFGGNAYGWSAWAKEGVEYVLLGILACQLAAIMTREWWEGKGRMSLSVFYTYPMLLCLLAGAILTAIVRNAPRWQDKFTDAEIAGSCYLVIALLVAWVAREGRLERPWNLILAGIVTITGGNAACAWLFSKGLAGEGLYFIPELAGLALLCWAGWKDWRFEQRMARRKAEDFRRSLGEKIESLWPESGEYWEREKLSIQ